MTASGMQLNTSDEAILHGEAGPGAALAMRVLSGFAATVGARSLLPIQGSHIGGCLYHGQASLDFIEAFRASGTRVRVPTTLNVGSLDLIHPGLVRLPAADAEPSRRLMEADPGFARLLAKGVTPVVDTCTYITPILQDAVGAVMANSGKWAHYAPSNLGVEVAFGEMEACVASALAGRVIRSW